MGYATVHGQFARLARRVNSLIWAQVDARLYHISAGYKLASQLSGKL